MIDRNSEAYFRGRKLKGRSLKVPEGYKGIIIKEAAKEDDGAEDARRQNQEGEGDNEEDEEKDTELHEIGSFDEVMLWGHESMVEEDDAFSKGMGEWIGFAEAVSPLQGPGSGCEVLLTR